MHFVPIDHGHGPLHFVQIRTPMDAPVHFRVHRLDSRLDLKETRRRFVDQFSHIGGHVFQIHLKVDAHALRGLVDEEAQDLFRARGANVKGAVHEFYQLRSRPENSPHMGFYFLHASVAHHIVFGRQTVAAVVGAAAHGFVIGDAVIQVFLFVAGGKAVHGKRPFHGVRLNFIAAPIHQTRHRFRFDFAGEIGQKIVETVFAFSAQDAVDPRRLFHALDAVVGNFRTADVLFDLGKGLFYIAAQGFDLRPIPNIGGVKDHIGPLPKDFLQHDVFRFINGHFQKAHRPLRGISEQAYGQIRVDVAGV